MFTQSTVRKVIFILFVLLAIILGYLVIGNYKEDYSFIDQSNLARRTLKSKGIIKFTSEKDFKSYIAKAGTKQTGLGGGGMVMERGLSLPTSVPTMDKLSSEANISEGQGIDGGASEPQRVSETNVQVLAIDEPDIVKTNGKEIYFSHQQYFSRRQYLRSEPGIMMPNVMLKRESEAGETDKEGMIVPPMPTNEVSIIKAFPVSELAKIGSIDKNGNLFLTENILVIFSDRAIYGYDVSTPASAKEIWKADLKDNTEITTSRLYNGRVYIISRTSLNSFHPCPLEPLVVGGKSITVGCADIYHPANYIPVEVTYTILTLDPKTGNIEKTISFIGSYNDSAIYMSPNSLYVTYTSEGDMIKFYLNFLKENQSLVPIEVINKLARLETYDISQEAKTTELNNIMSKWQSSLNNDERLKLENELNNKMTEYGKAHKRDLEATNIVKISLNDFKVEANGNVPGRPLNQFSLDEYLNNLRIAVTVGEASWWGIGFGGERQSANDVYVLDPKLKIIGEVKDLGLEERIYSARFIDDRGYLVTFRQTDPFYVLDLSNPNSPALKGELKIPGFSSYLHPLGNNRILGVGQENGKVKLSLFDVAIPDNPLEIAKYSLDDYWTEVSNNHHAFLLDSQHEIFFLPGGRGGYVFSYKNNFLEMVKAVADMQAKRAVYINDSLYVIGEDKIVVLDENKWEEVGKLEL